MSWDVWLGMFGLELGVDRFRTLLLPELARFLLVTSRLVTFTT